MKKLRKIVAADEDVKKSLKLSSLRSNVERIQGYLRLDDSLEVTPKEYFIDIDDSGAIGVYAQYDVGFELELNKDTKGKVRISSTSKIDLESEEIKDVATWLFNLNIEGAEKVYEAAQEIVDEYDLKGIDDLIEYVNKKDVKSSTALRRRGVNASEAADTSRYVLLERRPGDNKYTVVDTADTVANVKRLAYDWYDSDRSHLPKTSAPSEYWGYDTIKHKAYLPKWFSEDEQTFDYSLPITGLDDIGASVDVRCSCHGKKKSVKAADTTPGVKQLWDFLIESGWVYDAAEYFDIDSSTDEEAAMRAVPKRELMRWIEENAYDEFVEYFDIEED